MSSVEIKLDLPDNLAREAETNGPFETRSN